MYVCGKILFANNNIPELLLIPLKEEIIEEKEFPFRRLFSFLSHIVWIKVPKLCCIIFPFPFWVHKNILTVKNVLLLTFLFTELEGVYLRRIILFTLCSSTESCFIFSACGCNVWKETRNNKTSLNTSFFHFFKQWMFPFFFSHWGVLFNVENHSDSKTMGTHITFVSVLKEDADLPPPEGDSAGSTTEPRSSAGEQLSWEGWHSRWKSVDVIGIHWKSFPWHTGSVQYQWTKIRVEWCGLHVRWLYKFSHCYSS